MVGEACTTVTVRRSNDGRSAMVRWYGPASQACVERTVRAGLGYEMAAVVYGDGKPVVLGGAEEPVAIELVDDLGNRVDLGRVRDGATLVARVRPPKSGGKEVRDAGGRFPILGAIYREVRRSLRPDDGRGSITGPEMDDRRPPRGDWNDPRFQQTLLDVERVRSHLANERNILAWTRAALTLASQGIAIWKLYAAASDSSWLKPYLWCTGALIFFTTPMTMALGLQRWKGTKQALNIKEGMDVMSHFGKLGVTIQAANIAVVCFAAAVAFVVVGCDDNVFSDFQFRIFD